MRLGTLKDNHNHITGMSETIRNKQRRAFICHLLTQGVSYAQVIEQCQAHHLFTNCKSLREKSERKRRKPGKKPYKPFANSAHYYVLQVGSIKRIINRCQQEICETKFDRDDEIGKAYSRLLLAYSMSVSAGDVSGMIQAQRAINKMLGLKRSGMASFDPEHVRQQMAEMDVACGSEDV